MKTSDYVTVGFIAIFITAISYFLVNSILGDPSELTVKFETIAESSDGIAINEVSTPDPEVFNEGAINPTVEVYIGSCEDTNQDGELDDDERRNCGLDRFESDVNNKVRADYLEQNNGLSNEENEAINNSLDLAPGTTARQREAIDESVDRYQQEREEQDQNANDPARRETVSGS